MFTHIKGILYYAFLFAYIRQFVIEHGMEGKVNPTKVKRKFENLKQKFKVSVPITFSELY